MARPELGTKRACPTTGRKFYDLDRDPITSPYTGESWPRASFEPQVKAKAIVDDEEDEEEGVDASAVPELVSLDEAEPDTTKEAVVTDDDVEVDDDIGPADDTFLEPEEEGDEDVADLIDGDIEGDEET